MIKDDLDLCSKEQIHIPGCIQAHGILVILINKVSLFTVVKISIKLPDYNRNIFYKNPYPCSVYF